MFDKKGGLGAAAQGFDPVGTGSGKQIEDAGFGHESAEGGEDGGADTVLGGAESGQGGNDQLTAPMDTSGDTEKATPSARMTWGLFFPMTFRWLLFHRTSYASS